MSEQEGKEIEELHALITRETEKAVLAEPMDFAREESLWIPKSQLTLDSLEIKPWMLKRLGFLEQPLCLQLPDGGWEAVEKRYQTSKDAKDKESEAGPEEEGKETQSPGSGATVHDDNPENEPLIDRDGDEHVMTLNEKLTQIKTEAIEDGLDAVEIERYVKTFACIWNYIKNNTTFKSMTEIQRGYAASGIFRELNKREREATTKDDDQNVVKVYKMPYMGGGIEDGDSEARLEDLPKAD